MTRQQDAERRLVDDLAYAWMTSTIPPMGEDIARLIVQRIGKAIAADPSLIAAFGEQFGERRSQTITQAAHGSSTLTELERAQIAAQFDDECGSVTGSMEGDGNG